MKFTDKLRKIGACSAAVKWAEQYPTLQKAWDVCERGDWMLWLAGKLSGEIRSEKHKQLVLTTCKCARLSLHYIHKDELRPLKVIETAEQWARGENGITIQQVSDAASAADAAADAAATAYAAAYAANAANAANAAYAADAAAYAAYAAAYAAYAAAAYAADAAAAAANAANAASAASAAYAAYAAVAAAASAADAADAANAAADAAKAKILLKCANIVRTDYPKAPRI